MKVDPLSCEPGPGVQFVVSAPTATPLDDVRALIRKESGGYEPQIRIKVGPIAAWTQSQAHAEMNLPAVAVDVSGFSPTELVDNMHLILAHAKPNYYIYIGLLEDHTKH